MTSQQGPLRGLKVIEIEGLGPAPFCGMMLADMGAEVISITRKSAKMARPHAISERGKRSIAVNLKSEAGVALVLRLCESADVLIEGFRPGVAERLGIGPEQCLTANPKLIYGRMTGWGQDGPLAQAAGHDLNYIALSGALHGMGHPDRPPRPPLNLVGDFGGGGMFLAFGILCAVYETSRSGKGQVIDVSMVEGSANLMHMMYAWMAEGRWQDERGVNLLDGAAYFYDSYETADGKFITIAALEPQFYALLRDKLGLSSAEFDDQHNRERWPALKQKVGEIVLTRSRDEWCELLETTDVCFAPVLSMREVLNHPHNRHRQSFYEEQGVLQPSPAPKFSRSAPARPAPPHFAGEDNIAVLAELGYNEDDINNLIATGVLV
ncbi:CoA transferase [Spongiibacter taiwanensis]|uniref:CaiB/BaiF CoA transferase family protein n=1 Tax=Spongiibacter taiwanensis TaxID=1748242 RepID=UPI002034A9F6|nr:CaiB/BaiF CoA-transferase family protein [Spongiibacter taiwanensis]USA44699.1 CoA transferase [Spongiibacter taiwanensis]